MRGGGMVHTFQSLRQQRNRGEIDGFTLIELLIVIVVLGILAAVVIFALGGITGKSAVAACQADGATVSVAIAALETQYPGTPLTTGILTGSTDGGPYLQSWPNNATHYTYTLTAGSTTPTGLQLAVGSAAAAGYVGPSSCNSVK
jgi:prepilin-type N-terminal cleavage/methylation domain-containing protein